MKILAALALAVVVGQSATVVKDDRTPLRKGCYSDSEVLATLPQGVEVAIRYALSGESVPCYKVAVDVAGKTVEGYLAADKLKGLEEFDQARREARLLDLTQAMGATRVSGEPLPALSVAAGDK